MQRIVSALFIISVFLAFLTPMELGDVWWHLKTGQWISEHLSLPSEDPFSIAPLGSGGMFTLRGNWLSEVFFYLAFLAGGIKALPVFKALLFAGAFLFIEKTAARNGLGAGARILVIAPAVFAASYYDELRPQSVSMLMFAATICILEKKPGQGKAGPVWMLPPMMAAWSNMHGGFVSGAVLIAAYAAREAWVSYGPGSARPVAPGAAARLGLMASAPFFAALNPNGLRSFGLTSGMVGDSIKKAVAIHEHLPLSEFASLTGDRGLIAWILVAAAVWATSHLPYTLRLLSRKGGPHPDPLLALFSAGLLYASFATYRAGVYFVLVSSVAAAKNLAEYGNRERGKMPGIAKKALPFIAAGLIIAVSATVLYPRSILRKPLIPEGLIPAKTADFIKYSKPDGNIFHPYEWGGYFIWRLHPDYRVFVDGRAIGLLDEYQQIAYAKPGWEDALDRLGVKTAAFWPLFPYKKTVPPIVLAMLKSEDWRPVYWDLHSVVFMKNQPSVRPMKKDSVWELLASLIGQNVKTYPNNPAHRIALGDVNAARGFPGEAMRQYENALALDPDNAEARARMEALGK